MNDMWILAKAGDVETSQGQAIPAAGSEQMPNTETGTIADGSNGVKEPLVKKEMTGKEKLVSYAPFIIILIIMYLFIFRGPKKKQKQHAQMVDSLKKNDRVRTIGGIFATVIDVRDKEVVIKIDESNNTKMRVSPGAIASVITDEKD
jgi:preprotein translocase subunit YajC